MSLIIALVKGERLWIFGVSRFEVFQSETADKQGWGHVNRIWKAKLKLIAIPLLAILGCTKHDLAPLNFASNILVGYGKVDAHLCTDAPSPATQNLKYLYILDHSASNQPGFPNPLTPSDVSNTDSRGSRRYGPLVNFTRNMIPDPVSPTSFALINFNDTARQPVGNQGFDPDATNFIAAVTSDWIGGGTAALPAPNDSGFTNYQGALQLAQQLIVRDAQMQAASPVQPVVKTSYVIIFVSDGVPTVATPTAANPVYTQQFNTDISPVINSIMDLKNDPVLGPLIANITLNTAYYANGTQMVAAVQLLEQMAVAGNGQYLQFDSGQNILYQQFAPPSRNIRNELVDVFVENENAVWWTDGSFLVDSDGDGLPDMIEVQGGSNRLAKDSDGNGVNDLVEYRTKGHACDAPNCAQVGRDPYTICAGFSPTVGANNSVTFSSSANDGLNDCEKFLLGANRYSFNTNGDLIPDSFALRSFLPIIPGSADSAFSDPFIDGIMNYNKIKAGLPIQVSRKNLGEFEGRLISLTQEASASPDIACYHLVVDRIARSASTNSIRVMLVQNSSAVQNKPFLKSARASITDGQTTASFLPRDFR